MFLSRIIILLQMIRSKENVADQEHGIFDEENLSVKSNIWVQTSLLNKNSKVQQYVTYRVENQELCGENINDEITRNCDRLQMFVSSGEKCHTLPKYSEFEEYYGEDSSVQCDSEDNQHICTGVKKKCPYNDENSGEDQNYLSCCVVFRCANMHDNCLLKAKSTFSLGASLTEKEKGISLFTDEVTVEGYGFDPNEGNNLFTCKDEKENMLSCECTEVKGNIAKLKFKPSIKHKGALYAAVEKVGFAENEEKVFVKIGTVQWGTFEDYKYYILGALGVLVVLYLMCCDRNQQRSQPAPLVISQPQGYPQQYPNRGMGY